MWQEVCYSTFRPGRELDAEAALAMNTAFTFPTPATGHDDPARPGCKLMERSRVPIVFSVPDVREPSGAVRLALRHQRVLRANGFPTSVVSPSIADLSRWGSEEIQVDTLEPPGEFIRALTGFDQDGLRRPGRKVILARRAPPEMPASEWAEWTACGVEAAVAVSEPVKSKIESRYGVPTAVIFPSVDRTIFAPAKKDRSIAYMPRQNPLAIRRILDRCRLLGYSLLPIEAQSHSRVGEILARASIFLAAGPPEEFGLASLEAMACGCVVVGFASQGGREFMEDGSNCLLAADGDCEKAAHLLELAVRLMDEGRTSDLTQEALRTARKFSPGREAVEILRFWGSISEGRTPNSPLECGPGEMEEDQP